MAEACSGAYWPGGRADYLKIARRVLATLSGAARALLVENDDAPDRVGDAPQYLRVYARMVSNPQGKEQRR